MYTVQCTLADLDCSNKPYLDTIVKSIFFSPSKIWHGMGIRRNKHTNCSANFLYMFFCCLMSFYWSPRFYMVTHPSANHGPSCLTSVILRELVFPTWYCRSLSANFVLINVLFNITICIYHCNHQLLNLLDAIHISIKRSFSSSPQRYNSQQKSVNSLLHNL